MRVFGHSNIVGEPSHKHVEHVEASGVMRRQYEWKWSLAHWKQSSTGSYGGDGGCSNVASHQSGWSLNRPPCGKRKGWDPPLQLQLIQNSHVRFLHLISWKSHMSVFTRRFGLARFSKSRIRVFSPNVVITLYFLNLKMCVPECRLSFFQPPNFFCLNQLCIWFYKSAATPLFVVFVVLSCRHFPHVSCK